MNKKNYAAICAVAKNGIIGKNNDLPWPKLKEDMRRFVSTTKQKDSNDNIPVMIMGRKTFESWGGKLLKGRLHILLTENVHYRDSLDESLQTSDMLVVLHSKEQIMNYLATIPNENIFVVGGPAVWEVFWDEITIIYKTLVDVAPQGDVAMPVLPMDAYTIEKVELYNADDNNPYNMKFIVFTKERLFEDPYLVKNASKGPLYEYGIGILAAAGLHGPQVDISDVSITFAWDKSKRTIRVSLYDMQTAIDESSNYYSSVCRSMYTEEQKRIMDSIVIPVMETGETFGDPGEAYDEACRKVNETLKNNRLSVKDFEFYKN